MNKKEFQKEIEGLNVMAESSHGGVGFGYFGSENGKGRSCLSVYMPLKLWREIYKNLIPSRRGR